MMNDNEIEQRDNNFEASDNNIHSNNGVESNLHINNIEQGNENYLNGNNNREQNQYLNNINQYSNYSQNRVKEISIFTSRLKENYPYFLILSIIFGVLYSICLYNNYNGIGNLIFVSGSCCLYILAIKKLQISIKKYTYIYLIVSILLGISIFLTTNKFIIFFNKSGILLLAFLFITEQMYENKNWSIGLYITNGFLFIINMIVTCIQPITHLVEYLENHKKNNKRKLRYVIIGIVISIPILIVVVVLLSLADELFNKIFGRLISYIFFNSDIIVIGIRAVFGIFLFYSSIASIALNNLSVNSGVSKKLDPVIGITFSSIISAIYALFCTLQIYQVVKYILEYKNFSYAEFARRGFFELLFVSVMNFIMIMICCNCFKESKALKIILTFVSGCTYILIGSSAYKIILYIREYNLTFLRILVLLGLLFLAFFMGGLIVYIYNRKMPIVKYILIVGMSIYIVFSFMKPDQVIVRYNLAHFDYSENYMYDIRYLVNHLSLDAIPDIAKYQTSNSNINNEIKELFEDRIEYYEEKNNTFIKYNFSEAKAYSSMKKYLERTK
jgi:hypothetical protein